MHIRDLLTEAQGQLFNTLDGSKGYTMAEYIYQNSNVHHQSVPMPISSEEFQYLIKYSHNNVTDTCFIFQGQNKFAAIVFKQNVDNLPKLVATSDNGIDIVQVIKGIEGLLDTVKSTIGEISQIWHIFYNDFNPIMSRLARKSQFNRSPRNSTWNNSQHSVIAVGRDSTILEKINRLRSIIVLKVKRQLRQELRRGQIQTRDIANIHEINDALDDFVAGRRENPEFTNSHDYGSLYQIWKRSLLTVADNNNISSMHKRANIDPATVVKISQEFTQALLDDIRFIFFEKVD